MLQAVTSRSWRIATAGLAAGLALTFLIGFTAEGQVVAARFLAQFRSQRFTAVAVDPERTSQALAYLDHVGSVEAAPHKRPPEAVKTIADASQRVGYPVKQPNPAALPPGLNSSPQIQVLPATEFRFAFDRAKARSYFDANGQAGVGLPEKFDGASLVVEMPAAVLLVYRSQDGGPGLVVGQAGELVVGVDGNVTLEELREFLLGLPGLPPETVRELRAIQDWRTTFPIPVPVDSISWQQTTLAGGEGLLLSDTSGLGSVALWNRDGRVYGVAGPVSESELRRVADSLR